MLNILKPYRKLESHIVYVIATAFCLQFINSIFFLALNIYMTKCGYPDYEIANFVSYRFLAVVLFAVPFGLFIKGKRLRPIYLLASMSLPILSLIIIESVERHIDWLLQISLVLWGVSFSGVFISTLPYILRNANKDTHTEAISLNAASWSTALIVVGFGVYILSSLAPDFFVDKRLLQFFSCCGFLSLFFALKMRKDENIIVKTAENKTDFYKYDWWLIFRAAFPVFMIALGAGLIIPFMNLFFYHIFDMDIESFAVLGSTTSILVALGALLVPKIKERFGYEAITPTQLAAVLMLFLLGTTDFISHHWFAVYLAIFCYIMRQPLMNLANPLTSQMTMYYVGKKNQEIMSAIMSSIWSGSWFFSSQIFRLLREHFDLRYGYICYITASLYLLGVVLYFFLIKDFRRKEKAGLIV
ncbi:MAG: MFS transporter [Chitinophagales bacterium]